MNFKLEVTIVTPCDDGDGKAMSVLNLAQSNDGSFERVNRDDKNYSLTFRFDNDKDVSNFLSAINNHEQL